MMYDHEKSDLAIVAVKPTNKAGQPAAELAEPRAGNASQQSTGRAQYRGTVSQALKRMRNFVRISRRAVTHPRWEPNAGPPHRLRDPGPARPPRRRGQAKTSPPGFRRGQCGSLASQDR